MKETLIGHLQAELIRFRRSSSARFSLIGLLIGILSALLSIGARNAGFESAVFSWQVMYFTGMAGPLMMTLGAVQVARDKDARLAGLPWRGSEPKHEELARLCGAAMSALCFHILSYGTIVVLASAPLDRSLQGIFLSWIGSLGMIPVGSIVARRTGYIGAFIVGILWQIVGTLFVESPQWIMLPPTWSIRILLEPTGVNMNGTPLSPSNPVLDDPRLLVITLTCLLAVLTTFVACFTAKRKSDLGRSSILSSFSREPKSDTVFNSPFTDLSGENVSNTVVKTPLIQELEVYGEKSKRKYLLGSFFLVFKRSGLWLITLLSVMFILMLSFRFDAERCLQFTSFAVLPIGAGLLPIITWGRFAPGFVSLYMRARRVKPFFLFMHSLICLLVSVGLLVGLAVNGMQMEDSFMRSLIAFMVATALSWTSVFLVVRFGSSAAVGVSVVWTIISILLGGDVLAETGLWLIAFPAWPYLASTESRFFMALCLSGLAMVVAYFCARRALTRSLEEV